MCSVHAYAIGIGRCTGKKCWELGGGQTSEGAGRGWAEAACIFPWEGTAVVETVKLHSVLGVIQERRKVKKKLHGKERLQN